MWLGDEKIPQTSEWNEPRAVYLCSMFDCLYCGHGTLCSYFFSTIQILYIQKCAIGGDIDRGALDTIFLYTLHAEAQKEGGHG